MDKEIEINAVQHVRSAGRRRLDEAEAGALPFAVELPPPQQQPPVEPLTLSALGPIAREGANVAAELPEHEALQRTQRRGMQHRQDVAAERAQATVNAEGVQVDFYDEQQLPGVGQVATTVVIAQVVGDALLSFRGRRGAPAHPWSAGARREADVVVEMMPSETSQEAQLTLRHPELGKIVAKVDLRGDRLSLRISALSERAARSLRGSEKVLRDALKQHGVMLAELRLGLRDEHRKQRTSPRHVLDEEA